MNADAHCRVLYWLNFQCILSEKIAGTQYTVARENAQRNACSNAWHYFYDSKNETPNFSTLHCLFFLKTL